MHASSAVLHTGQPTECLALEDSLNGVLAAKSARMKCIAIPEEPDGHDKGFYIADVILRSLEQRQDAALMLRAFSTKILSTTNGFRGNLMVTLELTVS